ncbi:MAG: C4-dicarboxylate transporter DctA [Asticcacaulis sp. 32-58-5]|nr:MAG: C4-dicarboxylate transporter DctA [Asticcacaulis sp. 32-58-5]
MLMSTPSGALTATEPPKKTPFYTHLYFQVLIAIVLGAAIGHFYPQTGEALKPLGDGFIKLVKMIISPVIFLTIVTGIAGMGSLKGVGSVTAKAHDSTLIGFVMSIIPTTFTSAFVDGNILQVLFIAILFGISLIFIGEKAKPLVNMLETISHAVFRMVHILMKAAPIGAFGAFAFTIGKYGIASIVNLAALVGTFYATSALFVIVILGAVCAANGFSIFKLIAYLKAELLLVLGTSSSESALPSLMEKMEQAGCKRSVVGLVVPTGYSFNLDGTNIYMTLAALFIAQATNTHLTLEQQLLLLSVAMLSSKGAAGVTGAGFITLAATLSVVPTVPIAGMAIILGVDRFMSECRSLTNFIGNAVATVVVSRWEKSVDMDTFRAALSGKPTVEAEPVMAIHGAPAGVQLGEKSAD